MQRLSAILLATLTGLVGILAPLAGGAETLYVTDKLYLGVYEQKGKGQTTSITSGTALEVLDDQGAWLRVRLPDSTEGWVKSKYLVDDVPAGIRLAEVEKELETLRAADGEDDDVSERIASLGEEKSALEDSLSASQLELVELREALDAANAAAEAARVESEQLRADLDASVAQSDGDQDQQVAAADPAAQQAAQERAAEAEARADELLVQRDELRDREAQLGAELQALRAQVASALSALGGTPGGGGAAESEVVQVAAVPVPATEPSPWDFIARLGLQRHTHALYVALAAATLAIGFWLGIRWLDYRIRKRTGGVQIW